MRKLLSAVLIVVLLAGMVAPVFAQETPESYTVKSGDTLSAIAKAFGLSLVAFAKANGIANLDLIFAGETLNVTETGAPTEHTVRFGDTLSRIATRYGTTVKAIADLNEITNTNLIFVGTKLQIPASGE